MTTIIPDANPQSTIQTERDDRAWISLGFHGELSAEFYENVSKVVLQDKDRSLSIHLTPAVAAALAASLIEAAAEGGHDVEDVIDQAHEIKARRELEAMGPVRDFADVKHLLDL